MTAETLSGLLRTRRVRAWLVAELLIALALAAGLWGLRQQVLHDESRMLRSLARAMALQAERTLGVAETTLRSVRDELARGLLVPGSPQADELLRLRAQPLVEFRALAVFDAQGQRIATSREAGAITALPVGDLDFFRAARAAVEPRMDISEPYVALGDGRPAISVSMNWTDAQGVFRGAVALVAEPAFLEGGFERIAPSSDTRLRVYRADGRPLRAAEPLAGAAGESPVSVPGGLPRGLPGGPPAEGGELAPVLRAAMEADHSRSASGFVDLPDGSRRIAAVEALARQPLVVEVSRDTGRALEAWNDLAWVSGSFVATALIVTLALALRFARELALREALEQQLERARKLEALGKLAGGVAHDFNNILASVVGFGEMARQGLADGSREARQLDRIVQAGLRGKALVERILSFSRGRGLRPVAMRLQPLVSEVLDHVAASMPAGVRLQRDLRAASVAVRGDATAVYEAVMNLCTNAVLAMQNLPAGGTLAVSLHEESVAAPRALFDGTLAPGRHACLSVRDTGPGMTPDVMARLFEPFFTTRGTSGGTGLGLAVVHGIVTEMGGVIDVRSAPGAGACFTLYLPVTDEPVPEPPPPDEPAPRGQGQAVLVVDDEPALVELAQDMLAELGYEAFGLTSSERALQEFRAQPARFDLLLCDERMPGLSGLELVRELRAIRPDLPVVLCSGHGGADLQERAARAGVSVVLAKPLLRAQLARALAVALGGARDLAAGTHHVD